MVAVISAKSHEDPFALIESCQKALGWILRTRTAAGEPICSSWIQVHYGEEEITLLEEEVLPVLAQVLQRVEAIDHELELQQQAEDALEPAEVS